MKTKQKPTLFAVVVLQAMLLVMPDSAIANALTEQEIEIPQPMEAPAKWCFGATLSSDGEQFYTVNDGMVTQYRINPFKKLSSVAFDKARLKDIRSSAGLQCYVLITNDEKKLIVRLRSRLLLIDIRSGEVLNEYAPIGYGKDGTIRNAILNDGELVLIEDFLVDDEQSIYDLAILDTNTLSRKRGIKNLGSIIELPHLYEIDYLAKGLDKIYLGSGLRLLVLNSKTYNPELSLVSQGGEIGWELPKISRDYQTLYVKNVSKVIDHLTDKQTNYEVRRWRDEVLVFDQRTRKTRIESTNNIPKETFVEFFLHPVGASRAQDYLLAAGGRSVSTGGLANLYSGERYRFYQYESGEAILIEQTSPKEFKYFQLTPGAKKYLMMKTSEGKVIPINDATFAKYYRTEFGK